MPDKEAACGGGGGIFPCFLGSGGGSSIHDARAAQLRHAGSGGGGAVLLLADGGITVRGAVSARGGNAASVAWSGTIVGGGAGAGGSILVRSARGVVVTGGIDARGGVGQAGGGGAGGNGFVRIESYGAAPVLGFGIAPPPSWAELPSLRQTDAPRRGATWQLTAVAMPADPVFLFLSLAPANMARRQLPECCRENPLVAQFGDSLLDPARNRPGGVGHLCRNPPGEFVCVRPLRRSRLPGGGRVRCAQ